MTNADQPQDITGRLEDIDRRLEALGDEIDLARTIESGIRVEVRTTSQRTASLEQTVAQLRDIARDHQLALRLITQNAERDRQVFQSEIRRVWEYLLGQSSNGNS
ncbi:hypothetical protein NIES4071_41280 [Calothrix sp. NIES-4071]|nr:hypothetical protein NIES4071_41280 [Calothrix sp. NIES-4071]BAZ58444.1 hypothetical protein NIES4105_41220 [Calothrix sp. NIES-4105]